MVITNDQARSLLKDSGLRATEPRLAVLVALSEAKRPLSHSEVVQQLGESDWDPATVYRNLVKLREVGLAVVVSRAEGIDRYSIILPGDNGHRHPHFVCEDCGQIECLPEELIASMVLEGKWSASIRHASVQLSGKCPECLAVANPK